MLKTQSLFFLCVLSCLATKVTSLDCYFCVGSDKSDCAGNKEESKIVQQCVSVINSKSKEHNYLDNLDGIELENHCVSFKSTATENLSAGFQRGCGTMYKDENICEFMIKTGKATTCSSCQTDLCNI